MYSSLLREIRGGKLYEWDRTVLPSDPAAHSARYQGVGRRKPPGDSGLFAHQPKKASEVG